jgi:hypothetical protein
MAKDKHIYGEVNSKTGLKTIFKDIRQDVANAKSRPASPNSTNAQATLSL